MVLAKAGRRHQVSRSPNCCPPSAILPRCSQLCKKLDLMSKDFKLWLEFEEVDPGNWDNKNEFCNIHVDLPDGRHYGINVWTYKFLQTAIDFDKQNHKYANGRYLVPPDLFVKELTRDCIELVITDLLKIDDLEKVLNPSILR